MTAKERVAVADISLYTLEGTKIMPKIKNVLEYCQASNTIRQMPQNYMIAVQDEHGRWTCDADLASDKALAVKVFLALFEYDVRYGDGENLLKAVEHITALETSTFITVMKGK